MFGTSLLRAFRHVVPRVHCDSDEKEMSLIEQADAAIEAKRLRVKTPMAFESVKNIIGQGGVASYDGFRVSSQKQINLNSIVSHFFWMGSQAIPQPMYQYRVILHDTKGETMFNVGSDMDFNVDGEFKTAVTENVGLKTSFMVNEQQGRSLSVDVDIRDASSFTQVSASQAGSLSLGLSYMQSVTPTITLGGSGTFLPEKSVVSTSFAGIYDDNQNQLSALWTNNFQLCYLRRVNPNRVNLSTELKYDPATSASEMSVSAEYILKQSRLNMSLDSSLGVKSVLETTVVPGVNIQLCSDVNQIKDQYRFGFGIVFGNN